MNGLSQVIEQRAIDEERDHRNAESCEIAVDASIMIPVLLYKDDAEDLGMHGMEAFRDQSNT